jgi:ribose-phosphate pyrophosphokinase
MIFFAFEAYETMAAALLETVPQLTVGRFRASRYENGELHLDLQTPVAKQRCLILGSIAPPDEQLLSTLLLAHTLKKGGASRVTAILPYLAYARHDKDKPGESLATAWAGALAEASGVDGVITVDVHSEKTKGLFPVPVVSLSPAQVFAEALHRCGLSSATIVAPDEGAIGRCEAVKIAAGRPPGNTPYFEKRRTERGIQHSRLIGEVGSQAVIIDDILDTGGTLLSACEKLVAAGVEEIYIMVTHGLFTGERWKQLWQLGVKRIFCTDSVAIPPGLGRTNIARLSVVPLIASQIRQMRPAALVFSRRRRDGHRSHLRGLR